MPVEIIDSDRDFKEVIQQIIATQGSSEFFEGVTIISVETGIDGRYLHSCYGLAIALDMLKKDPEKHILCLASLSPNVICQFNSTQLQLVLQYKNVWFVELQDYLIIDLAASVQASRESKSNLTDGIHDLYEETNCLHDGPYLEKLGLTPQEIRLRRLSYEYQIKDKRSSFCIHALRDIRKFYPVQFYE